MPSTPAVSPGSHACVQFLNTVLSRPNVLPYEEDVKYSIRQHLLNLIQHFPGLQARTQIYTHNDGRQVSLLQSHGTIPMYYQDVKYNIPVTIWLLEPYPRKPPLVYVTPTRDMIIKPRHALVDASGLVSVPYLTQWLFPRSNLVELVQNLSLHFGHDPPLYSRPSPPPPPTQHATTPPTTSSTSSSSTSSPLSTPYPPPYFQPHASSSEPAEVFKKNAIVSLSGRLQQDVETLRRSFEVEMEDMFNVQAYLNQRSEQLAKLTHELQREKEALEQQLQLLLTNTDVLESWLNGNDAKESADVNIDEALEPCDALSRQMLECAAEDLAIEDVLYSLDKGVQQGVITADSYLKHVRMLARDQFFHRATSDKVKTAQVQAQVTGMAARAAAPYIASST